MKKLYESHKDHKKIYYCATLAWDNSPRRKNDFLSLYGFSLESFYDWTQVVIKRTREMHQKEERFMHYKCME